MMVDPTQNEEDALEKALAGEKLTADERKMISDAENRVGYKMLT